MRSAWADMISFSRAGEVPMYEGIPKRCEDHAFLELMGGQLVNMAATLRERGTGPAALRARLMVEELGELLTAIAAQNEIEIADGLADLVYVTVGTALQFGSPLPMVWDEVQRSNMAKFPACETCQRTGRDPETFEKCVKCNGRGTQLVKDRIGKILKPDGWTPPDIAGCLRRSRIPMS